MLKSKEEEEEEEEEEFEKKLKIPEFIFTIDTSNLFTFTNMNKKKDEVRSNKHCV